MKAANRNSLDNQIQGLRPYILALMEDEGRDFNTCEYCGKHIPDNHFEIHHTRYEGATYYDLMIVCRSCNKIPENVGLI
jgi:5-methylcytosine-specific restriction endonuclease McrA